MFDTVLTWPGGSGFFWERLVRVSAGTLGLSEFSRCGTWSVGHIAMSVVASVQPGLMVSNCYK